MIENDIKYAIKNSKKIEDKLNVIIVISNASSFARRFPGPELPRSPLSSVLRQSCPLKLAWGHKYR